jgi:hypothetical protein
MWLRRMPEATLTFKESTNALLALPQGMKTLWLHLERTVGRSPCPSLPMTRMVGCARDNVSRATALSSTEVPTTCQPVSLESSRNRIKLLEERIVITSKAPAEALLTTELSGEEFLEQRITSSIPKKKAERRIEPKF